MYVVGHGAGAGRTHDGPRFTDVTTADVTAVAVTTADEERACGGASPGGDLDPAWSCPTSSRCPQHDVGMPPDTSWSAGEHRQVG